MNPGLGDLVLEGRHVRLEPLAPRHRDALLRAAAHAEIWTWFAGADPTTPEGMDAWLVAAFVAAAEGSQRPFAVVLAGSGEVIGSTRYCDIHPEHRTLEVGYTWYRPDAWGTPVNPESKILLFRHAFEDWGARRVSLKTDHMNARSQAAIRKLGAREEGILRNDRLRRDGTQRPTVVFSITAEEWPDVQQGLVRRIQNQGGDLAHRPAPGPGGGAVDVP